MAFPIEASCQCGQVSYRLKAAPLKVFACHCTECQKLATAPYSVTAIIPAENIEFSGEMVEWGRSSDSGNRNHAKFCPGCGNRIYHFNPDDASTVKLKLKPVDPAVQDLFAPQAHLWVSQKQSWLQLPDDVPAFEKQS
ncbi:MAG: GFA family protein [Gammaproteobacteria bacterium]|nr:GFA family protein [Gammaproteobacteria bacterium]